jgi:hypothetical protein
VALLEKRRYLNNRSGDFPQVILIVPSHVPNSTDNFLSTMSSSSFFTSSHHVYCDPVIWN